MNYPAISYIIDPRFPGGTSSAIAKELAVATKIGRVSVHAVSSKMFSGRPVAPQLLSALQQLGLELIWDARVIKGDVAILHNPSFLKFDTQLRARIIAKHLFVVSHENFQRPGGYESFDVRACLGMIDNAALALKKSLAPISTYNRTGVNNWLSANPTFGRWDVYEDNWFNICDFDLSPPTIAPRDRRGRLSRPGLEKFPTLAAMDSCFPQHANSNVILGADVFLEQNLRRAHWKMLSFGSVEIGEFFEMIDFMVYFTSQTWRESFGRVLAEAIAAGKVVISDAATGSVFGGAVISAKPAEVDEIIDNFVRDPMAYQQQVNSAQRQLASFSSGKFAELLLGVLSDELAVPA